MKILFLDTSPIRRGAQVFISELADYLSRSGHETFRVYLYKAEKSASKLPIRSQGLVLNFDSKNLFEKIPTIQPVLLKRLIEGIKEISPDIILLNGSRTLKYGAAAKQFLPKRIRWVSRIIDNAEFWNAGKFTHWYYKSLVIPQLDASIGVSQASLDSMIRHYNFKKPTTVIYRVFDPRKFKNAPSRQAGRKDLGLDENDEVLLFLGNLTAQKRPDRFLEIIQKLAKTRPQLKALVVGDGDLGVSIKSQISNLQSQTFFFGYQQDVSPYLAAADLLILTSDTEGLPGVVLEAAYFEVPTIATEVGGIRECLIDGETGYLIPDRSVDAFCQKINQLFDQPNQRIQLGQNAKKFTSEHFRMDKVAQHYLDFFQQIINHP
ncbi:glycosyltransferase family 4 protein [Algoriphagus sp.]|uniref:glycosyltransferase family 4 protein n=1 Tax=Algoriphagus sp. TaxID=1872435 RepID=UPI0032768A7F